MGRPDLKDPKDFAYWERNQLVAALSKLYPSWLERHPAEDKDWEDDWRWIVFIQLPGRVKVFQKNHGIPGGGFYERKRKQLSWHIHDSEVEYFKHLPVKHSNSWDGHTTEEKYERLATLKKRRWL
jgi:hypothetical protein